MIINLDLIKSKIQPNDFEVACQNWELIESAFSARGINDVYNLAGACATVAVETGCTFKPEEEHGNASYFLKNYWSNKYVRKMLGNKDPNDAILYHGRGYIQLTGKFNYHQATEDLEVNLLGNPAMACNPTIAAKILVWFWQTKKIDQLCTELETATNDTYKIIVYQEVRRLVNGGLNGLTLYMNVLKLLGVL